jgi:hypothetical protein
MPASVAMAEGTMEHALLYSHLIKLIVCGYIYR